MGTSPIVIRAPWGELGVSSRPGGGV